MHGKQRRWGRGLGLLVTTAVLGAGLVASGAGAQAATPASRPRIAGGVEDGTFSPTCLRGHTAKPDTAVLSASRYRDKLGDVVRILVPYNIATNKSADEFKCLKGYLKAAARDGAAVEVSLNRVAADAAGPSLAQYRAAVGDLAKTEGSGIRYLTAWNEPNNSHYLPGPDPATRAGQYFTAARKAFPGKMVAGDFASGVNPAFLSAYIKAIGGARPGIWAIHPYTDVTNFQYYLNSKTTPRKTPQQAGTMAAANSKVLQFARYLHNHGYGPDTRIWINEIYIDHTADKVPPPDVSGKMGTTFSPRNQAYAALFLSGGLGADSLPGVLAGHDLPQLTRYIYLRADDASTNKQKPDADVLEVHFPATCLYGTLARSKSTPAPHCS